VQAEIRPMLAEPIRAASRAERVRNLVERRARVYQHLRPFRRGADVQRIRSGFVRRRRSEFNRLLRAELLETLAPDLRGKPGEVVEALDLALSFEAWERLTAEQGLEAGRARDVIEQIVLALLR